MTENRRGQSPKQQNGNDCRVFTILSIYLIFRGVQILSPMYYQHIVTHHLMRRSIASALKTSKITPPGLVATYMIRQGRTTNLSTGLKKQKRKESRVTLGKRKLWKDFKYTHLSKDKIKVSLI